MGMVKRAVRAGRQAKGVKGARQGQGARDATGDVALRVLDPCRQRLFIAPLALYMELLHAASMQV